MLRRLRAASPALVISLIALFIALGGTTYAATSLPKNSVGTKQIKNGAVTKSKISHKTISALKGNTGSQGPTGPQGNPGAAGANGTNGTNGTSVTSTALSSGNAHCATGGSSFTAANGTTFACNGAKGDPGDPATADGPAVEVGTTSFTATSSCAPAPLSGESTGGACAFSDFETASSPVPADTVVDNLTVTIPAALATDFNVGVLDFNTGGTSEIIGCVIPAGQTSCTNAGPSGTVSAGTSLVFGTIPNGSQAASPVNFSYELSTPGVTLAAVPAAASHHTTTTHYSFSR